MTKKEKARIKAELIRIRDKELGRGVFYRYICFLCSCGTREFVQKNKPTSRNKFKSFTKGKYWKGTLSWWNLHLAEDEGRFKEVIEEKKRYLTQLIETL